MTPVEANEVAQRVDKLYRQANFHSASDEDLEQGIRDLAILESSLFYQGWYPVAREKFQQEFLRRKQKEAIQQGAAQHGQIMDELGHLKTAVGMLARARCVDKWILVFGAIAALTGAVLVILALIH